MQNLNIGPGSSLGLNLVRDVREPDRGQSNPKGEKKKRRERRRRLLVRSGSTKTLWRMTLRVNGNRSSRSRSRRRR